jgi:cell wall-associated NlpC family hydrolase
MSNNIVASARGWIGTRFHHQGRLKKTDTHSGGVDCLGLLIGVAAELNLPFTQYDETSYSHYPDTERLKHLLAKVMREIPVGSIQAGDILLLNVDNNPQHLAIVSEFACSPAIIHAYAPARAVVEHALDAWWQQRIAAAFRVMM